MVVGVPGVVDAGTGRLTLATNVPGLEGRDWGADLRQRLDLPVSVENDINLAAVGERWRGVRAASRTSSSSPSAPASARGSCSAASCTGAGTAPPARSTWSPPAGTTRSIRAPPRSPRWPSGSRPGTTAPRPCGRRTTSAGVFAAARAGDPVGRAVVEEEARRIALHIAPISAVTDIALVVLGGGIGVNADLLLDPIRTSSPAGYRIPLASRCRASGTPPC